MQAFVEVDVDVQRRGLPVDHRIATQPRRDAHAFTLDVRLGVRVLFEVEAEAVAQHRRGGWPRAVVLEEQLFLDGAVRVDHVGAGERHAVDCLLRGLDHRVEDARRLDHLVIGICQQRERDPELLESFQDRR